MDPPEPELIELASDSTARPKRKRKAPRRADNLLPDKPAPIPSYTLPVVAPGSAAIPQSISIHIINTFRTGWNRFGLLREYKYRPSYDPDAAVSDIDLQKPALDQPALINEQGKPPPWPFSNMSKYLLMEWTITGSHSKSIGEVDRLAKHVLGHPEFRLEDVAGFSTKRENHIMDSSDGSQPLNPAACDGWLPAQVPILIPTGIDASKWKPPVPPSGSGKEFLVPGLYHRPLLPVLKAALVDVSARLFHFSPFKRIWRSPSGAEHRCFDEAYTTDAWLEAHDQLQRQANEPGCGLEKVILGCLFSSDATHLATYGVAKVWPLYLYILNLSKYIRWDPNSGAAHHVAYIPSVSSQRIYL